MDIIFWSKSHSIWYMYLFTLSFNIYTYVLQVCAYFYLFFLLLLVVIPGETADHATRLWSALGALNQWFAAKCFIRGGTRALQLNG